VDYDAEKRNGVRPEIGTGTVRAVGDLGKSRNWESRKLKSGLAAGVRAVLLGEGEGETLKS
jgi:hypothetical protein